MKGVRSGCHLWTDQDAPPSPTLAFLIHSLWVIWHEATPPREDKTRFLMLSRVLFTHSQIQPSTLFISSYWLTVYSQQLYSITPPRSTCRYPHSGTIAHTQIQTVSRPMNTGIPIDETQTA